MPRKDRRFTGEDIRRIYCNNLTPIQRHLFDITDCNWSQYSTEEQVKKVFKALFDSGLLDDFIRLVPGGNYIGLALDVIRNILELGAGGVNMIDLVPVFDLQSLFPDEEPEKVPIERGPIGNELLLPD
jgi:hypothetical protein